MRLSALVLLTLASHILMAQGGQQISLFTSIPLNSSISENSNNYIRAFPDGGWVASSFINQGSQQSIVIMRYDKCAELVFCRTYASSLPYIRLQDFIVDDKKQILLCGYSGSSASSSDVFAIMIDSTGNDIWSKTYENGNANHTYSIGQMLNGNYFINGNSHYAAPNTSYNFLITVDPSGNVIQAREYISTVIWGRARACSDGGVITRTGSVIYKTNSSGNLEWMNTYNPGSYTAKALEVSDGYVFGRWREVANNRESHLYKLSLNGNILWNTAMDTVESNVTLSSHNGSDITAVASKKVGGRNVISIKRYNSGGKLLSEQFYAPAAGVSDYYVTDHVLAVDGSLLICGYVLRNGSYQFFTAKTKTDHSFDCGLINSSSLTSALIMTQNPATPEIKNVAYNVNAMALTINDHTFSAENSCFIVEDPPEFEPEIGLLCSGTEITLDATYPGAEYLWHDGSTGAIYLATQGGNYWVDISICGAGGRKIFVLDEGDCNCTVFLPNAFTPNGSGLNDTFAPVFNCEFTEYRMDIYNKWGELIFRTENANEAWSGAYRGGETIQGVYVYVLKYRNFAGAEKNIKGTVTVLR